METKINIAKILNDKPEGTKLWTDMFGIVTLYVVTDACDAFQVKHHNKEPWFDKDGKLYEEGVLCIYPSKSMRDWSKFAWKKGDVLVSNDGKCKVIFDKFDDDTYTSFVCKYYVECYGKNDELQDYEEEHYGDTVNYTKESEEAAQTYIKTIEKRFGGKLNRETLEIEKQKKPVFEIGKLYVFNEDDEDGELTIIGELIDKNESEDTLRFGIQYEIETEKFVTDQTFDLRISVNKELREATENEVELFNKHYDIWKNGKEAKEHPAFKPFDKVLVRSGRGFNWHPALFVRYRGENSAKRYIASPINTGKAAEFTSCIPYDGHENIAFTSYDIEDLPF